MQNTVFRMVISALSMDCGPTAVLVVPVQDLFSLLAPASQVKQLQVQEVRDQGFVATTAVEPLNS